ncbi:MAG: hypothetical protein IK077_00985 [Thermoguttaceae bacterium]|nr:hypothetical protein [Thermoguttaceae bacterium]
MGRGVEYQCECGYRDMMFYGTGFFTDIYFKDMIKKGEYGKKWKYYMMLHPFLKFREERVLSVCPSCGFFKNGNDIRFVRGIGILGMLGFGRKEEELVKGIEEPCDRCGDEMEFFFPKDIDYVYQNDPTRRSKVGKIPTLHCPECGKVLKGEMTLFWD